MTGARGNESATRAAVADRPTPATVDPSLQAVTRAQFVRPGFRFHPYGTVIFLAAAPTSLCTLDLIVLKLGCEGHNIHGGFDVSYHNAVGVRCRDHLVCNR